MNDDWLDDLPKELAEHARVLRTAREETTRDVRLRALQVQGSIGRGEPDRLSDIDLGLVVDESAWPAIAEEMPIFVRRLGEVVDDHFAFVPGAEAPDVLQVWALLSSGIRIDLLVLPTSTFLGSGPDGRTLVDPDGILLQTDHPSRLTDPAAAEKWAFSGWHDLAESAKNIARGRPVAAAEWLGAARLATISCWACAHGLEYAGLANVVAARLGISCPWPDGLEKTYPALDLDSVLTSALALGELHSRTEVLLQKRFGISPRRLGGWVTLQLESLRAEPRRPGTLPARRSPRDTASQASRPSTRRPAERQPR